MLCLICTHINLLLFTADSNCIISLTNFGSAPAGPGNFRFLFVDVTACALFVQRVAAVDTDSDITGNGVVQEVVQPTVVEPHSSTVSWHFVVTLLPRSSTNQHLQ